MDRSQQIVGWTGRVCALVIPVAVGLAGFRLGWFAPAHASVPVPSQVPEPGLDAAPHISADAWRVFVGSEAPTTGSAESASPFATRFRLAGTFFAFGESAEVAGRAIVDDLQAKQQTIARTGDLLEGYRLVEVGSDRATFVKGADQVTLQLGFQGPARVPMALASATNSTEAVEEERVLEQSAFGKRVAETRWVLNRQALMAYYQDLLENPERIASLYSSMKPDYRNEEIAGYRVNQEGERDFFKAMGFREGDVVRKVNSMNMTSQSRAEYFIGEFVKSRLNAVVIDVEREGKSQKMIYLIR